MKNYRKTTVGLIILSILMLIGFSAIRTHSAAFLLLPLAGIFSALTAEDFLDSSSRQILKTGIPATAIVQSIRPTGNPSYSPRTDTHFQAELVLEVKPTDGPAFQTRATHYFTLFEIPQYQLGATLVVKYDQHDKNKVAIVGPLGRAPSQA